MQIANKKTAKFCKYRISLWHIFSGKWKRQNKIKTCSKLTINTPKRRQRRCSSIFIGNPKQISHIFGGVTGVFIDNFEQVNTG